jgi:hypothetical protein
MTAMSQRGRQALALLIAMMPVQSRTMEVLKLQAAAAFAI